MGRKVGEQGSFSERIPKNWSIGLVLFLVILGAYHESLPYPFLNFDDPYYIQANPYIRDLSWTGIKNIFSQPIVHNYFPLQILSYAFDYQLWNLNPFGYRLHNVLLHVLNAVLVFLLVKKIFSHLWVAFLTALFFGLHPVNVESVTWISERKNVLSMAFLLLSFLSYLYYQEESRPLRKKGFYAASLFLFSLALMAKVSAVVLPGLLFIHDFCFFRERKWKMVKDKLPFLALAFFFSILAVWVYRASGDLAGYHGGSPYKTFLAMAKVFVEYIIYLVVPYHLDHLYWIPIPQTVLERQVLLSMAAIFLLVLLAWRSYRADRFFFFWFGWFFISLLPVLNIVPLIILRADRYMYLPAIGFFYLLALGLWKISRVENKPLQLPILLLCSLLVAGPYALLTMERNKIWKDTILFWEETLKKFPESATPYRFIGALYAQRGEREKAISYYQAGLRWNPKDAQLLNGLALVHKSKKDLEKAEFLLVQAKGIDPELGDTYNNLGMIYMDRDDLEKAEKYLRSALEKDTRNAPARANLGVIYFRQGALDKAIEELEKAVALSPGSIEPYLNLALIHKEKGLLDKAKSHLQQGLDYDPQAHAALLLLGRIFLEEGKIPEARYYFTRAYKVNPQDPDTRYFLGLTAQRQATLK
ncbi:MAG: tetratricopeptide repeat protein [Syntrophaceae bacterium]|nr:tetratricopeptide repeat protein [Syntrophaceae bacterium]